MTKREQNSRRGNEYNIEKDMMIKDDRDLVEGLTEIQAYSAKKLFGGRGGGGCPADGPPLEKNVRKNWELGEKNLKSLPTEGQTVETLFLGRNSTIPCVPLFDPVEVGSTPPQKKKIFGSTE